MARGANQKMQWGNVRFYYDAFDDIRTSPEVQALVAQIAEEIADEATNYPQPAPLKKYRSKVQVGEHTTTGIVAPASPHAANSNAKHNTLVKLIGRGGRG